MLPDFLKKNTDFLEVSLASSVYPYGCSNVQINTIEYGALVE
jgi:hypothetical protein